MFTFKPKVVITKGESRDGIVGRCRVAAQQCGVPHDQVQVFTDEILALPHEEILQGVRRWFTIEEV